MSSDSIISGAGMGLGELVGIVWLKDLTEFIAPILESLFNKAIDENKYPDPLKTTKLIELYKTGDKTPSQLPTHLTPANHRKNIRHHNQQTTHVPPPNP